MNINNFGPKSAMNAKNVQNLQNPQKTDKSGLVGEPQEATAADRPEGETEVYNTIFVTRDKNGNTTYVYDGYDNGYIVDGGTRMYDPDMHSILRDYVEKYGDGNTAPGGLK